MASEPEKLTGELPDVMGKFALDPANDPAAVVAARAYALACRDYKIMDYIFKQLGFVFHVSVYDLKLQAKVVIICTGYEEHHDKLVLHTVDGATTFLHTSIGGYRIIPVQTIEELEESTDGTKT